MCLGRRVGVEVNGVEKGRLNVGNIERAVCVKLRDNVGKAVT